MTETTTTTLEAHYAERGVIEWGIATTTVRYGNGERVDITADPWQSVLVAPIPVDDDGDQLDGNWAAHDTRDAAEAAARAILGEDVRIDQAGTGEDNPEAIMTLVVRR